MQATWEKCRKTETARPVSPDYGKEMDFKTAQESMGKARKLIDAIETF